MNDKLLISPYTGNNVFMFSQLLNDLYQILFSIFAMLIGTHHDGPLLVDAHDDSLFENEILVSCISEEVIHYIMIN